METTNTPSSDELSSIILVSDLSTIQYPNRLLVENRTNYASPSKLEKALYEFLGYTLTKKSQTFNDFFEDLRNSSKKLVDISVKMHMSAYLKDNLIPESIFAYHAASDKYSQTSFFDFSTFKIGDSKKYQTAIEQQNISLFINNLEQNLTRISSWLNISTPNPDLRMLPIILDNSSLLCIREVAYGDTNQRNNRFFKQRATLDFTLSVPAKENQSVTQTVVADYKFTINISRAA